nr:MAG TPA: hypothetical protein [Caudoviricetes sp.]
MARNKSKNIPDKPENTIKDMTMPLEWQPP